MKISKWKWSVRKKGGDSDRRSDNEKKDHIIFIKKMKWDFDSTLCRLYFEWAYKINRLKSLFILDILLFKFCFIQFMLDANICVFFSEKWPSIIVTILVVVRRKSQGNFLIVRRKKNEMKRENAISNGLFNHFIKIQWPFCVFVVDN